MGALSAFPALRPPTQSLRFWREHFRRPYGAGSAGPGLDALRRHGAGRPARGGEGGAEACGGPRRTARRAPFLRHLQDGGARGLRPARPVGETFFTVTLRFGGQPKRLSIPYGAVSRFYDPSVQFLLQFESTAEAGQRPLAAVEQTVDDEVLDPPAAEGDGEAKVVSLDQFRKK